MCSQLKLANFMALQIDEDHWIFSCDIDTSYFGYPMGNALPMLGRALQNTDFIRKHVVVETSDGKRGECLTYDDECAIEEGKEWAALIEAPVAG